MKVLGLYTGHAFTVCDVFGNGDSACFEPDPFDKDVLTQSGTAHDVKGSPLNDIANRVAGGGSGIEVQQDPPNVEYFLPPAGAAAASGAASWMGHSVVASWSNKEDAK